jgi:hypothetical protein
MLSGTYSPTLVATSSMPPQASTSTHIPTPQRSQKKRIAQATLCLEVCPPFFTVIHSTNARTNYLYMHSTHNIYFLDACAVPTSPPHPHQPVPHSLASTHKNACTSNCTSVFLLFFSPNHYENSCTSNHTAIYLSRWFDSTYFIQP